MSRRFNRRQRRILAAVAGGSCEACDQPLETDYHADHKIPVALGGLTTLDNGRATCRSCNLLKGKKLMLKLRKWQEDALTKVLAYFTFGGGKHFIINAAPGAGKTKCAAAIAAALLARELIDRVIVIAPRKTVVEQWAIEFRAVTGRRMEKVTAADQTLLTAKDVCATWNAINGLQDLFQSICRGSRTLVICDEHHHAAIKAAWGVSAESAFADAAYCLVLTGTPVRSDGAESIWFDVDQFGGLKQPAAGTFTLTYGEAVELGYCRPVVFHRHWGRFEVQLDDGLLAEVESGAPPVLPPGIEVDRLLRRLADFDNLARVRTFEADEITPRSDSYQASMFGWASHRLDQVRHELPSAGGLVIAPSIAMAKYFSLLIERHEGSKPILVHSDAPNAAQKIDAFRHDTDVRWLVSVGMVAEGVDIPRLRVLAYLPSAHTELAFRQAVGRVVRNCGPNDHSRAYVIMPAIQKFDEFARRIENDMPTLAPADESKLRQKVCRECGAMNELGETCCHHCGTEFPGRRVQFVACECSALNPSTQSECLTCGSDMMRPYKIKLHDAARDGIISRGIALPEEAVLRAEKQTEASRELVRRAEAENQLLAGVLRTFPLELVPELARLAAATGLHEADG